MIVSGEITLPAPRHIVFDALQNAPFFASCVDGVRDLKEIDATHYDAMIDTKVAYHEIQLQGQRRGDANLAARADRGQDRRHPARRGRPPDGDVDDAT